MLRRSIQSLRRFLIITLVVFLIFRRRFIISFVVEEDTELESSRVKEAALDDKLGIELRSIVEQIQVSVTVTE